MKHRSPQERSRYGQVMATLNVSITALKAEESEEAHEAIDLLNILSLLDANEVPITEMCEQAFQNTTKAVPMDDEHVQNISTTLRNGTSPDFLDL